jgi:hypothetical protein
MGFIGGSIKEAEEAKEAEEKESLAGAGTQPTCSPVREAA